MGQEVNPKELRVGVIKDWDSRRFVDKKDFGDYLVEDYKIRELIKKESFSAGISSVSTERASNKIKVTINTAEPGMVTGRQGVGVEKLKNKLEKSTGKKLIINVEEIRFQDLDAQLVAENTASRLERRTSLRRAMKQITQRNMRAGALDIRTMASGRLGGVDMVRSEGYSEVTTPLQTLRATIDYGLAEADTTYGKLGIKVWLYKGEILPGMTEEDLPVYKNKKNGKDKKRRNNNRKGKSQAAKN